MNAQELLKQLGSAVMMLGAKNFLVDTYCLTFTIGRNPKGVSKVRIIIAGDDTYNIETFKVRKLDWNRLEVVTGVYVEQLHTVLKSLTGLETRL